MMAVTTRLCIFLLLSISSLSSWSSSYIVAVAVAVAQSDDSNEAANMASQVCNALDLSQILPPPYGNITNLKCAPVWNSFILRYQKLENDYLTIILSAMYTRGWVGIGFSDNGMMIGSSAMVGWIGKGGKTAIKQYYLNGFSSTLVKPDSGDLEINPNVLPYAGFDKAEIYLAFQVKYTARVAKQAILLAIGTKEPVHGKHTLAIHDDKTSVKLDFSTGSEAKVENIGSNNGLKRNHGIMGIIGWGLLLPVGAIVARYCRHWDPLWFNLHSIIQLVGFLFAVATVVAGKVLYDGMSQGTNYYNSVPGTLASHRAIGIFVLVLAILQILAFFLRPDKKAMNRKYWNWYHHWVGRIALFFASLNIVLGFQVGAAGLNWQVAYGFLLGITLVSVIVLEILLRLQRIPDRKATAPTYQMEPL